jgi:hypothetical protein
MDLSAPLSLQVYDLEGDCQLLPLTEDPHFCPQCKTGFSCEAEPSRAPYEVTCKSCIADSVARRMISVGPGGPTDLPVNAA